MSTITLDPINLRTIEKGDEEKAVIIAEARERMDFGCSYWDEMWREWMTDVAFLDGEQWDPVEKLSRIGARRPALVINTLPQYVDQVYGDILQNRPSIHVDPSDSAGSKATIKSTEGESTYSMAKVYEGLIRNIEYSCGAESHYDTAARHAIEAGMGYLRVATRYSEGITMDQEAYIPAVRNRWSVVLDPLAQEPDHSDGMWGFILTDMHRKEFEKRWPGRTFESMGDTGESTNSFAWWTDGDIVRVAEYFCRVPVERTLVQLTNGKTMWESDLKGTKKLEDGTEEDFDITDELASEGITVHRSRSVTTYKVEWYRMTGRDILEGPVEWPGTTIPIVPVPGNRVDYPDKSMYRGLIYHAKDAKIAENFYISASVERIAMSPKSPWIIEAEQVEGFESIWRTANTVNHAYLPYNRTIDGAPPQRQDPAAMPVAELQMVAVFTDKVKATLGMYDAAVGARSNETSGKAITARQRESDVATYKYADNLAKAIRRVGLILCEVIARVFDSERVVRIRDRDGTGDWVKINETILDEQSGQRIIMADVAGAKMDVVVRAGPSYTTQRVEAVEALMEFVRVVPAAGQVILDKIASNMDWPGADEVAARLIKLVPPQFLSPKEIEENKVEEPKPTPEQQAEIAKSQAAMKTAEATIATAQANVAMAQAKTEEAKAKLAEVNANAAANPDDKIAQMVKDAVAAALAQLMAVAENGAPATPQANAPAQQKPTPAKAAAKKAPAKKASAKSK
jgi:hypothetical protein